MELIRLQSCVTGSHHGGKPEIHSIYHIQTVNNFHTRLQRFLRSYNGVSTKYLNHYVNLFVWIENHKALEPDLDASMKVCISGNDTYIAAQRLFERTAIPSVA